MNKYFHEDKRLGILLPVLDKEWHEYPATIQLEILATWEIIRGHIPDRIKELEATINVKQARLNVENDFECSCLLNSEIAELASIINDLWIWFRTNQSILEQKIHG